MNPVEDQISWLDGIPFFGYLKSLIYYRQGKKELAAEAFKRTTHNTAVAIFGVKGGKRAGKLGSVISVCGGIAGGLLSDVLISILGSSRYGYLDRFLDRNMERIDWIGLLQLAIADGIIGKATYEVQQLVIYLLNIVVQLANQKHDEETQSEPADHVVNERGSGNSNRYNCLGSISAAVDHKSPQILRFMDTVQIQLAMICIIGILGVLYLLLFYILFKI